MGIVACSERKTHKIAAKVGVEKMNGDEQKRKRKERRRREEEGEKETKQRADQFMKLIEHRRPDRVAVEACGFSEMEWSVLYRHLAEETANVFAILGVESTWTLWHTTSRAIETSPVPMKWLSWTGSTYQRWPLPSEILDANNGAMNVSTRLACALNVTTESLRASARACRSPLEPYLDCLLANSQDCEHDILLLHIREPDNHMVRCLWSARPLSDGNKTEAKKGEEKEGAEEEEEEEKGNRDNRNDSTADAKAHYSLPATSTTEKGCGFVIWMCPCKSDTVEFVDDWLFASIDDNRYVLRSIADGKSVHPADPTNGRLIAMDETNEESVLMHRCGCYGTVLSENVTLCDFNMSGEILCYEYFALDLCRRRSMHRPVRHHRSIRLSLPLSEPDGRAAVPAGLCDYWGPYMIYHATTLNQVHVYQLPVSSSQVAAAATTTVLSAVTKRQFTDQSVSAKNSDEEVVTVDAEFVHTWNGVTSCRTMSLVVPGPGLPREESSPLKRSESLLLLIGTQLEVASDKIVPWTVATTSCARTSQSRLAFQNPSPSSSASSSSQFAQVWDLVSFAVRKAALTVEFGPDCKVWDHGMCRNSDHVFFATRYRNVDWVTVYDFRKESGRRIAQQPFMGSFTSCTVSGPWLNRTHALLEWIAVSLHCFLYPGLITLVASYAVHASPLPLCARRSVHTLPDPFGNWSFDSEVDW